MLLYKFLNKPNEYDRIEMGRRNGLQISRNDAKGTVSLQFRDLDNDDYQIVCQLSMAEAKQFVDFLTN